MADINSVKLRVWGDYALFTRPEFKTERVSYDVMTPSAARAILEAIHWKPCLRYVIDRIHVMKPVETVNFMRNEVGVMASKNMKPIDPESNRQQRNSLLLRNVEYIIEAHFELIPVDPKRPDFVPEEGEEPFYPLNTLEKHAAILKRRAKAGQCYRVPYFGCREFPVAFEWLEGALPKSPLVGTDDLGLMFWDFNYPSRKPAFFEAVMVDGVVDVSGARKVGIL